MERQSSSFPCQKTKEQKIISQGGLDDMRNHFDAQLEQLHQKLIEMGNLCEQVISMTYKVLMDEDYKTARELIEKDSMIDLKERDIESLCLKLLLQQQPVASDLRKVSAALKMITDMERIGDHATNISEWVIFSITGEHKSMN